MAKVKYYAVRVGKVPGVYESWEECKKNIDGFSNAEYKSFGKKEDAIAYLNVDIQSNNKETKIEEEVRDVETIIAYVDGSYSEEKKRYSFGCILITPSGDILRNSGSGDDPKAISTRNVAGELLGAMYAVKKATELGYKKIVIRHDYTGIAKWYSGEWRAKDDIAKMYLNYLNKFTNKIEIVFEKVLAHSGDKYNEEADKLAKKELNKAASGDEKKISTENSEYQRDKLFVMIKSNIMDSNEAIEYLGISNQKLSSLVRNGKLEQIKKGIYLRIDIEEIKNKLK